MERTTGEPFTLFECMAMLAALVFQLYSVLTLLQEHALR